MTRRYTEGRVRARGLERFNWWRGSLLYQDTQQIELQIEHPRAAGISTIILDRTESAS
jgi:hypothetical protein